MHLVEFEQASNMRRAGDAESSSPSNAVTRYLQLGVCVVGIYTCYLLYGVLQEKLYQVQPDGTVFAATVSSGPAVIIVSQAPISL